MKNLNKNRDNRKSAHPIKSIFVKDEGVAVKRPGSDSLKGGWRQGPAPKQLSVEWTDAVCKLFFEGTGEEYFAGSIHSLPVPEWDANFMLFDSEEATPASPTLPKLEPPLNIIHPTQRIIVPKTT